jgi:voltage-gated potassium channel
MDNPAQLKSAAGSDAASDRSLRRRIYRQLDPAARNVPGLSFLNRLILLLIIAATAVAICETEPAISGGRQNLFRALELGFAGLFLLEYVARFWTAPEHPDWCGHRFPRLRFALSPTAIIDLVAILPAVFALTSGGTLVLRFVRLLRILRLAKLARFSRAWRHIAEAVHNRRYELGLTLAIAGLAMLLSSTALYWAEADAQPDKFGSIPRAFWWAVVTLTTVGYGDVFPVTPIGKVLAAAVAVVGIGLIALPAGILASAFSDAVQRQRAHERIQSSEFQCDLAQQSGADHAADQHQDEIVEH